jgi:hypothetical protein
MRHSALPFVLANLLSDDCLKENKLHALGEEKLGYIYRVAVHF